ncbi:hypothetical protein O3M35_002116 [Rhynocoris fuscipes]|uniref:Uncharacterized protein n=1 Tax=Rhynocoris fuscipes TaxID=488301 RepID=A0AAW1CXF2_9HEMI
MKEVFVLSWIFMITLSSQVNGQCSKQDYQHCVKLADPLLRDPHLIYPDNAKDIELVCRTWSYFVDCVKQYTERCFTESRRQEFNKAVESPVSTIHKLCSMPDFREDYMKHAGCMKMTLTQDSHCGRHYKLLVSQVSGEAPTASVCCSHHLFRECVIDHTQNACDPESAPFSAAMLDKALSFLRDQCANFVPNQLDCPGTDFYRSTVGRSETRLSDQEPTLPNTPATSFTAVSDPVQVQTSQTQSTGSIWTTQTVTSTRQASTDTKGTTIQSSQTTRPAIELSDSPAVPWTPSTRFELSTDSADVQRTSFARGMSWSPSGSDSGGNNAGAAMDSTSQTDSQTWRVTSSDVWLPSSKPVMIDNAIDEPNQQGLESKANNFVQSYFIIPICIIFILYR